MHNMELRYLAVQLFQTVSIRHGNLVAPNVFFFNFRQIFMICERESGVGKIAYKK